jgi:hypothetical protein
MMRDLNVSSSFYESSICRRSLDCDAGKLIVGVTWGWESWYCPQSCLWLWRKGNSRNGRGSRNLGKSK